MHTKALTLCTAKHSSERSGGRGTKSQEHFPAPHLIVDWNSPPLRAEVVYGHSAEKLQSRVRARFFAPWHSNVCWQWCALRQPTSCMNPGNSVLILFPPLEELMVAISFPCHKISTCSGELFSFLSHLLEGKILDHTCFHSVLAFGLEGKEQNLHYWVVFLLRHEI